MKSTVILYRNKNLFHLDGHMKSINYQCIEDKFRHIAKKSGFKFHSMFVETFHSMVESEGIEYAHASLIVQFDANDCMKTNLRKLRMSIYRMDCWLDKKYDGYFCLKVNYSPKASDVEQIFP